MLEVKYTSSGNYGQLWSAYNAAQTNEKELFIKLLFEICQGIEEADTSIGRPRLPLRDMIFCMAFKVYSTFPSRRFMSDVREAHAKGMISVVPHFNSISNYMELESLKPILQQLVRVSSAPLRAIENRFAADSTALRVPLRQQVYNEDTKRFQKKRTTVKLHAMCGVHTNIITSAEVSPGEANDSPFFRGLVEETARYFEISEVYADGAYTSNENRRYVLIWGAEPFIAFRSNSVEDGEWKSAIWKQMLRQFQDKESEFWKHYHNRNNIESTFSSLKRTITDRLRSKFFPAQVNEALCMVLCHNLCVVIKSMFELGIHPDFDAAAVVRRPMNLISEQEVTKVQDRLAALTVKQPSLLEFLENTQPDQSPVIAACDKDSAPQESTPKAGSRAREKKVAAGQTELFLLK